MPPDDLTATIKNLPLPGKLSKQDRARLLAAAKKLEFEPGKKIYQMGQKARYYYWLLEGEVQLPGAQASIALGPDCGFGNEAFANALPTSGVYLTDAIAQSHVRALRLPRELLAELGVRLPALKSSALMGLAARVGGLELAREPLAAQTARAGLPLRQRIGWPLALVLPLLVWVAADASDLSIQAAVFLGLFTLMALMWLFALVDEYIPPIIAVVAMLFIDLVPAQVALHGFYSRTFLLLLGVYAVSAVIISSGLAYRLMLWVLLRLPDRAFWHRGALSFFGLLLSIVMPSSNARLALLLPLYQEMDQSLDSKARGANASALLIAVFTGATIFSPILLTAKSSNLAAFTMLPVQERIAFQGLGWPLAALVVAIGLLGAHLLAMRFWFRSKIPRKLPAEKIRGQLALLGPPSAPEWAAALAFCLFVLGAAIPQWHQSQIAWVAGFLLAGLLLVGLFTKNSLKNNIEWPLIFFLLCLDGLTEALRYLQLDGELVLALQDYVGWAGNNLSLFIVLTLLVCMVLRLAMPLTASMILAVTILLPVGMSQGIHPWIIIFLASLFTDIWFLPQQNPSHQQILGAGLGRRCNEKAFFHYAWALNLLRVALAFASIPYWRWLGLY